MFKNWRRKRACEHDYYMVNRFRHWVGHEYVMYARLYCPKCEHEYYQSEKSWEVALKKQRLRQDYLKRNSHASN